MGGPADEKPGSPRSAPPGSETAHDGQSRTAGGSIRPGGPRALIGLTISDRYRIQKLIGEGGMATVYLAEHILMRKKIAIKVLHPEMTRLPEVVRRFEQEAMAAANIDHPNVAVATDFGKLDDGSFYLALEYVDGRTLREVVAEGKLDLGRALHITRQIAAGLQRAHARGIVHRDLKPENVQLVNREGDPDFVKVLDFGIAKIPIGAFSNNEASQAGQSGGAVLTQAGMVYGTPEYMAPEQALGQPVDARADLYALGIMMFEMLTGVRPFEAESKVLLLGLQVTAPVPSMASKAPDANVPPEIEAVVQRLLAKEATERLADAKELIDTLSACLSQYAANGRVDSRYLSGPGSSALMSNPGSIISGLQAALPPNLVTGPSTAADAKKLAPAEEPQRGGLGWIIAVAAGAFGLAVLVVAIWMRKDPHPTGKADAGVARVDSGVTEPTASNEERIKDGIAMIERGDYGSGISKLEELGPEVENRDDVHRALLKAYVSTKRRKEAMREAGAILKANPDLDLKASEQELRVAIRNTAVLEGLSKDDAEKAAVDEAFTLLEKHMGTTGWFDLYEIAYTPTGDQYPEAAKRAKLRLRAGDRTKMGAAVSVNLDLQLVGASCAVKGLLDRAAQSGDERTLDVLKPLLRPRMEGAGRKKHDALACLHDGSLAKAIAQIEGRKK